MLNNIVDNNITELENITYRPDAVVESLTLEETTYEYYGFTELLNSNQNNPEILNLKYVHGSDLIVFPHSRNDFQMVWFLYRDNGSDTIPLDNDGTPRALIDFLYRDTIVCQYLAEPKYGLGYNRMITSLNADSTTAVGTLRCYYEKTNDSGKFQLPDTLHVEQGEYDLRWPQ